MSSSPARLGLVVLAALVLRLRARKLGRFSSVHSLLAFLAHHAAQPAVLAAVAWAVWRLLAPSAPPLRPAAPRVTREDPLVSAVDPKRERRDSFTITNERGEDRGSLDATGGWGWQVSDAPLTAARNGGRSTSGILRSNSVASSVGSSGGDAEPPPVRRRSSSGSRVRFAKDLGPSFYGFVFGYDGVCVAHGADQAFVGLTLAQVVERSSNQGVDAQRLHERFMAAAEAGGAWVSYQWRNSAADAVRLKGAYIIQVEMWGRRFYAGVGYTIVPPHAALLATPSRAEVAEATAGLRQKLIGAASARSSLHRLAGDDDGPASEPLGASDVQLLATGDRTPPLDQGDPGGVGTELPPELASTLRDHTVLHIGALQSKPPGGGILSPSVAAQIGYDRRHRSDVPLGHSVAALVGYERRRHATVPVEW